MLIPLIRAISRSPIVVSLVNRLSFLWWCGCFDGEWAGTHGVFTSFVFCCVFLMWSW